MLVVIKEGHGGEEGEEALKENHGEAVSVQNSSHE